MTKREMPKTSPESERQPVSRSLAEAQQKTFAWDRDARVTALYAIARRALMKRGGADALRAALDEKESYISSISKAFHQKEGRSVPIEWLLTLCEDKEAAYEFTSGFNELVGYEPPVSQRVVSPGDIDRAARQCIEEMDEEHREIYRRKVARKLGVRLEAVKF